MTNLKLITAAATLATASLAFAAPVNVTFTGTGAGQTVKIYEGSSSRDVFAGQIKHSISGAIGLETWMNGNQITYCADLGQFVSSSTHTFNTTAVSALTTSNPMGAEKADAIRDMFMFASGSQISTTANNDFATAFQLAIWEIINDFDSSAANNGLSMTSGYFKAKKTDGSALSSAVMSNMNSLFAVAGANVPISGQNFAGISSSTCQDQILSGSVVPTPGMFALLGCGSLVAMRRRRA